MLCDWCGRDMWPNESHVALIETGAGLRRERICEECWEQVSDNGDDDDDDDIDRSYEEG